MNGNDSGTDVAENVQGDQHEEVALRAYRLWQQRGSPVGSPEEDWFRAEQEISSEQAELKAA
jgi:hypothetical protein